MEKDKAKDDKEYIEIEKKDIKEVEHKTLHPGEAEFSLQNASFDPGENEYLNENGAARKNYCGGL
ncbi:hypothetical protein J2S74_002030 [Evansella vedderi]|uniref:Uncharacterized protein n=1 Tax=Evansella vedderi TaxID=38282 RepID=A0ABT9ZV92_9BACI|nr:hypothetical protein [Evansella vedderi]MDQ0254651.1 hypothetical protein [Evansella vedderi]